MRIMNGATWKDSIARVGVGTYVRAALLGTTMAALTGCAADDGIATDEPALVSDPDAPDAPALESDHDTGPADPDASVPDAPDDGPAEPADDGAGAGATGGTPAGCGGPAKGTTRFRAAHFNAWGATFGANWTTRRAVVLERMKRAGRDDVEGRATIYGLTEVTSGEAKWLAQNLGSSYAVAVHNRLQAVVYDTKTWTVQDTGRYPFESGSTKYHGFVNVRLKNNATGRQVNVLEAHLAPNAVDDAANKRARQLSQIRSTVANWKNPVLLLGDLNWTLPGLETAAGDGFCSIRAHADVEYPTKSRSFRTYGGEAGTYGTGGSVLDYGLVRGGVTMLEYRVLRGNVDGKKAGSDHHMLSFELQI